MNLNLYGWLVAITAGMGGFLFGYEIGIINQVFDMNPFLDFFGLQTYNASANSYQPTPQQADISGWITFTFLIGAAAGALIVSYPSNFVGRKWTIMLGAISFIIGVTMETIAGNLATLYIGRIIAGVGVGFMSCCVPLYISECAETKIRGTLISLYQLMITIGIFIATCVNSLIIQFYTDSQGDAEWRLAFGLQFIPCVFMMCSLLVLPFSPRWLAYVGRSDESLEVIARLRGKQVSDKDVVKEHFDMMQEVRQEVEAGEGTWVQLFTHKDVRYRTFLGITLQFFQQWTGINIILYFGSRLFAALGFSHVMSIIGFPLINSVVNLLATIPGMYLVERIGRKLLLTIGGFGMAISLILVVVFAELGEKNGTLGSLGAGSITFILVFVICFGASWGPVVWVYQSEIFPLRFRAKGTSASTVSNWVWNAIVSKIAPLILASISYYTYLIWAGFCIAMAFFTIFLVPETKGLSLEEIDTVFGVDPHKRTQTTELEEIKL